MRLPSVLVIIAMAPTASAGVDATFETGSGVDSSARYSTASADLAVESTRLVPLASRGLCGDGACLWASADPDDRDGIRADLSGTLEAHSGTRTSYGDASVTGRVFGWQLGVDVALQPLGSLRDTFWRSGRGVTETQVKLAMPPFVTGFTNDFRLEIVPAAMTVGFRSGGDVSYTDVEIDSDVVRFVSPTASVDVLNVHAVSHDRDLIANETVTVEASDFAFDVVRYRRRLSRELSVLGYGGLEGLHPLAAYEYSEQPDNGDVTSPRYGVELDATSSDLTGSLALASWARLDPTGYAADTGQLATSSVGWRHGRLTAHASFEGGRLVRRLVADDALAGTRGPGTVRWMGRGELEAGLELPHAISLAATAWIEHSDRDDPRWLVPVSSGELANHAGAGVTARWRLGRARS